MRYNTFISFVLLFSALCLPDAVTAEVTAETATTTVADVLARDEIVIPPGGASTNSVDTFASPEEAAAATDRQPFVYVSGRNIDSTAAERLMDDLDALRAAIAKDPAIVNVKNRVKGWTGIYSAARHGRNAALKIMIQAPGADLDATSKRGGTPVMAAAWFGHADTVQMLVEAGCSTSIRNLAGDTLFTIAQRRCPDVVPWLRERGITE